MNVYLLPRLPKLLEDMPMSVQYQPSTHARQSCMMNEIKPVSSISLTVRTAPRTCLYRISATAGRLRTHQ